ncbi:MAG: hypothetical protein WB783_10650 [Arenicellales bacterium]
MKLNLGTVRKYHDVAVFLGLLMAVAFVPIPLGSNRPYAWYALAIFVYGLLAIQAMGAMVFAGHRILPRRTATILVVLVVWLGFVFLQTLSVPRVVVHALNPLVYKLQQNLALISIRAENTLSVDPGSTYDEFLKFGCYAAVFYLTLTTVNTRDRLLRMAGVIVLVATIEVAFGLYCKATGFVLFPEASTDSEMRAGTFVNPHHYANLLMMVLGLVCGLMASVANSVKAGNIWKLEKCGKVPLWGLSALAVVALTLISGVLVAGAPAPVVFFGIAFGVVLLVGWPLKCVTAADLVPAPLVVLAALAATILIGLHRGLAWFTHWDLVGSERLLQDVSGLRLLGSVWATGVGAGNYRWVFPMFRSADLRFVTYDHAHNDYLEAAIGQGIPTAMILGLAVLLILRQLCKGYKNRRNPLMRGVILGSLVSLVFMLLDATIGFSFQIPANSVYFFVIAGMGLCACRIDQGKRAVATSGGSGGVQNE